MTVKVTTSGQPSSPTFDRPVIVLVEGGDDSAFVSKLISASCENATDWHVHEMGGNKTNWKTQLEVILSSDEFDNVGRSVGLVMDADFDQSVPFQRCRDILQENRLPSPSSPEQISDASNRWRTGIYIMPGQGRSGALEDLVLDAFDEARLKLARQYLHEVEAYRGCKFKNDSKSLVQAYLAGERNVVKTLKNAIEKGLLDDPFHHSLSNFSRFLISLGSEISQSAN